MESESRSYQAKKENMSVQQYVSALAKYDIISFDIFDRITSLALMQNMTFQCVRFYGLDKTSRE